MRKVVVTGGAGYIGSHVCKCLFERGFEPIVFDNFELGSKEHVKWGNFYNVDILDQTRLIDLLREIKPVAVFHLAGKAYVGESFCLPQDYYRINVCGTLNIIAAVEACSVGHLVFSSSCSVFGNSAGKIVSENSVFAPQSPYARTKVTAEQIIQDCAEVAKYQYAILRFFNAAGADLDSDIGETHEPETHLIPSCFEAALGERPYLDVFGFDYPTSDGTCIRDYIHVSDLALAHCLTLEALILNKRNLIFNLGLGKGFSVLEVIRAVERITGLKVPIHRNARRQGDPAEVIADSSLISRELGWFPIVSRLDDIITSAWNWKLKFNKGKSL